MTGDSRTESTDPPVCSQVGSKLGGAKVLTAFYALKGQAGSGAPLSSLSSRPPGSRQAGLLTVAYCHQSSQPDLLEALLPGSLPEKRQALA